jgi:hypothetical protein
MAKQSEPVKPTIWNVYKIVAKLVFLGYIAKNFDFHLVLGNIENSLKRLSPETKPWRGSYCHHPSRAASRANCKRSLLTRKARSAWSCSIAMRIRPIRITQ